MARLSLPLSIALLVGSLLAPDAALAQLVLHPDQAGFVAAAGTHPIVEIGFEDVPTPGSSDPSPGEATLTNPLVTHGLTIIDPHFVRTAFYPAEATAPDPANPFGGNNVLVGHPNVTFVFAPGTLGVLFQLEGTVPTAGFECGDVLAIVTDLGGTEEIICAPEELGQRSWFGASSPNGLEKVELIAFNGPSVAFSSIFTSHVGPPPPDPEDPPTPAGLVRQLVDDVAGLDLGEGVETRLHATLAAARRVLEDANERNDVAAIGTLRAFANIVRAERGKAIDDDTADMLIARAQQAIALLGTA